MFITICRNKILSINVLIKKNNQLIAKYIMFNYFLDEYRATPFLFKHPNTEIS